MGSGPFLLQEFVPDQVIKFAKNPNYWQHGLPYLDAMEWTIRPTTRHGSLRCAATRCRTPTSSTTSRSSRSRTTELDGL